MLQTADADAKLTGTAEITDAATTVACGSSFFSAAVVDSATDISADSADVILLNENMDNIVKIFDLGKRTIRIIKENLFWALFYNVCMIPLATGLLPIALNPMIASLAMTLSSLTVVLNSLRLLKK